MASQRAAPAASKDPNWNFRTFPVFFAFGCGALAAATLIGLVPGIGDTVLLISLFAFSFGGAHILSRLVIAIRARRGVAKADEEELDRRRYAARAAANAAAPVSPPRRRRRGRGR